MVNKDLLMDIFEMIPKPPALPIHYSKDGTFSDNRSRELFRLLFLNNARQAIANENARKIILFLFQKITNSPYIGVVTRSEIAEGCNFSEKNYKGVSKGLTRCRELGMLHVVDFGQGNPCGFILHPIPLNWDILPLIAHIGQ
jgi:hypothetical protein